MKTYQFNGIKKDFYHSPDAKKNTEFLTFKNFVLKHKIVNDFNKTELDDVFLTPYDDILNKDNAVLVHKIRCNDYSSIKSDRYTIHEEKAKEILPVLIKKRMIDKNIQSCLNNTLTDYTMVDRGTLIKLLNSLMHDEKWGNIPKTDNIFNADKYLFNVFIRIWPMNQYNYNFFIDNIGIMNKNFITLIKSIKINKDNKISFDCPIHLIPYLYNLSNQNNSFLDNMSYPIREDIFPFLIDEKTVFEALKSHYIRKIRDAMS